MHNISNKEKQLILVIVVLLGGGLLYNFLIEPVFVRFVSLKGAIKEKEMALIKNRKQLEEYATIKREFDKYPNLLKKSVNEEEELAAALTEIDSISKKTSCPVINIKPRTSKKMGVYKEISIDVSSEGDMGQITNFLKEIDLSRKLLKVKRFTIQSTTVQGKLKASFIIAKIILI